MSLDMGSIFIVNHTILNLGFWRAKRCVKLKQEASAKKAKACLCLFWPLPSVCPHSISSYQLSLCFAAGPTFFYEEYCKTFECPLLGIASNIAQTLSVGLNWFGCALFHRRTSAPTRLAEAVPLVDFAFSLSLAASHAISLAKENLWTIGRPNSGDDPTCSLLQLVSWFTHQPIISQVAGTNISTTGMFQTSLHWRMLRMYCAKCPAKYPAKNSLSLKVGGNICK